MVDTPKTLTEIEKLNLSFPDSQAIQAWKNQGKKVIAFQCTYVPEEIIYASGALPVRLIGDSQKTENDDATAFLYSNTCSFIRNCLQCVLDKRYACLDGFVAGSTCDCTRRLADTWEYHQITPFFHILGVPRKISESAYNLFEIEIRRFKERLESFSAVTITDNALQQSIALYNRKRELLKSLNELRKRDAPPVSGSEMLKLLNASVSMPVEQYSSALERLLEELENSRRRVTGNFRIMVSGSPLNNPAFIEAIEALGGLVVIDELCTGIRYWWEGVDSDLQPLKALSRRYLHNFACPRMEPADDRLQRILKIVADYRVDAVITQMVRYCVPQTMEQPLVREALEKQGIPVLELDVEYGMGGTGQITTRLQAFFEMLAGKKLK
jgi:bcr-type benzoyl-CoA reductase subunit C